MESVETLVPFENIKDHNLEINEYFDQVISDLDDINMFYFAKANKTFGEPGISYSELYALYKALYASEKVNLRIVETGMCYGTTTRFFLGWILKHGGELHTFEVSVREPIKEALQKMDLWKFVNVHGHSIKDPWDKEIDFLFIDTEHALSDALGEYMRFRVWLKSESIIGFHDTNCCAGVKRALEIIQEIDELELISEVTNNADAGIKFFRRKQVNRQDMPWNTKERI